MNVNQEKIFELLEGFINNSIYKAVKNDLGSDYDMGAVTGIMGVRVMNHLLNSEMSKSYYLLSEDEQEELIAKVAHNILNFVTEKELSKTNKELVLGLLFEVRGSKCRVRRRIKDLLMLTGMDEELTRELMLGAKNGLTVDLPESKLFTAITVMKLEKVS